MDAALGPLLAALLKMGAPWVVSVIFIVLFVAERKRVQKTADDLIELSRESIRKDAEVHHMLQEVRRDLDLIRGVTWPTRQGPPPQSPPPSTASGTSS